MAAVESDSSPQAAQASSNISVEDALVRVIPLLDGIIADYNRLSELCNSMADYLDLHQGNARIANATGTSVGLAGGILAIAGLCLAPVTMGTSFILTVTGGTFAAAGSLTSGGSMVAHLMTAKNARKEIKNLQDRVSDNLADLAVVLSVLKVELPQSQERTKLILPTSATGSEFEFVREVFNMFRSGTGGMTKLFRLIEDAMKIAVPVLSTARQGARAAAVSVKVASVPVRAAFFVAAAVLIDAVSLGFIVRDFVKHGRKSKMGNKLKEESCRLNEDLRKLEELRAEILELRQPIGYFKTDRRS